jgi:hypothetical protein
LDDSGKQNMRRILGALFLAIICLASVSKAQDDTLRVLFIGNSHTYYNDLPQLFYNLSLSGGHPVIKDASTIGGYTLEQHSTNATTLEKISRGGWNYVVLQEQSQYPVIDFYRYGSMYYSARLLDSLITLHGSRTALYMTWGYRNGGRQTINGHSSPDFVDYFQMQDSVTSSYTMLAERLSAVLVPAGNAWAAARTIDTTLNLWQNDNYHPTLVGSYLAACVFYATFFNESPVGLTYTAGLDSGQAAFLQSMAEQATTVIAEGPAGMPSSFELPQNYPNPFNAQTKIAYTLTQRSEVSIDIFDILGCKIAQLSEGSQGTGNHEITWDAAGFSSGIYFYRLTAGDFRQTRRMLLLK